MNVQAREFQGVAIGDVVSPQDCVALMTVERIEDTVFGLSLSCCWFEDDEALRFGTFPALSLDLFPSSVWSGPLRSGAAVRLKSRGPAMHVVGSVGRAASALALCEWRGPTGLPRRRHFPRVALADALDRPFDDMEPTRSGSPS